MSTLTEFDLARIAEDEAVAKGSGVIAWLTYRRPDGSMDHTELASATADAPDVWITAEGEAVGFTSAQVVFDERRVLADCEAKRQLLVLSEHGCGDDYERVQCAIALPYAEHPDYRQEWRKWF